ncbi:BC1872 family protein [Paenibacillus oleatilyticus]|uniref:BC1872 family protein n=1 Tax=Paenibacillus oleatilyticus TaxID=2594886 RepID=UPI001C1F6ADA|nr:hypothetical protein [Paenibacillus oleatilyticus]MBU7319007.1 hypothetical protein [Paenibacillus oleatilyticus]
MNEQQVRDMKPGRELDALVAKAMGWTNFSPIDPNCDHAVGVDGYRRNFALDPSDGKQKPFPLYSTDISAAWEVVEKFPLSIIERTEIFVGEVTYTITIYPRSDSDAFYTESSREFPHAVCLAALLALRGEEQQ